MLQRPRPRHPMHQVDILTSVDVEANRKDVPHKQNISSEIDTFTSLSFGSFDALQSMTHDKNDHVSLYSIVLCGE